MRTCFAIFLLTVGCMGESNGSPADTPTSIVIAESGTRIAEMGRFEGIWRKPDGTMRKTGVYLAMWIPYGGSWRLKSEAFVTLACTGSATCDKTG